MQNEKANFLLEFILMWKYILEQKIIRFLLFYFENTQVLNEDIEYAFNLSWIMFVDNISIRKIDHEIWAQNSIRFRCCSDIISSICLTNCIVNSMAS